MPIEETRTGTLWEKKADNPADAHALLEQHGSELQRHGAEEFQKSFLKDQAIGFDRVSTPDGGIEMVRRDRVDERLARGYGQTATAPRMQVPELPFPKKPVGPGRHKYKYKDGQIVEVT